MPTPWPNPAPRIVKREAASALAGRASSAKQMSNRAFMMEGATLDETRVVGRSCDMDEPNAADLFVDCLESEGVEYVFGIPGEETLDLNRALEDSDIRFVPVRHEQGGAYMADMYGRLTRQAGVCLGTLGPGATNLVTSIADAYLDHAPVVALTGQGDLGRMHQESHQYIDLVSL